MHEMLAAKQRNKQQKKNDTEIEKRKVETNNKPCEITGVGIGAVTGVEMAGVGASLQAAKTKKCKV